MDTIASNNGKPDSSYLFSTGSANGRTASRLLVLAIVVFLGLSGSLWSIDTRADGVILTGLSAPAPELTQTTKNSASSPIPEYKILTSDNQKIDVSIVAGHAVTTVQQTFTNHTDQAVESNFQITLPHNSTVSQFTALIDNELIHAYAFPHQSIFSNNQPQQTVEPLGSNPEVDKTPRHSLAQMLVNKGNAYAGNSGNLTLSGIDRFDLENRGFMINLTAARSFREITTTIVYIQKVKIDNGIGSFSYRLGNNLSTAHSLRTGNSSGSQSSRNDRQRQFAFDLSLHSTAPVTGIYLPGFTGSQIRKEGSKAWQVSLSNYSNADNRPEAQQNNADPAHECKPEYHPSLPGQPEAIVVQWCLETAAETAIELTTFTSQDSNNNGFVALYDSTQTPDTLHKENATFVMTLAPNSGLAPLHAGRDWIFILDSSSSMQDKFAVLAKGIERALLNLTVKDRFRIIRFNNSTTELTTGWQKPVSANIKHWKSQLQNTQASGGTNLYAGVESGFRALDPTRSSAVVLVTDGEANIGTVEKKAFLELMKTLDVRLFTAVVGEAALRPQLGQMAQQSNGLAVSLPRAGKLPNQLVEFTRLMSHEALYNLSVEIENAKGFKLLHTYPTTLYSGDQLTLMGQFEIPLAQLPTITVTVNGMVGGKPRTYTKKLALPAQHKLSPNIEAVKAWADINAMQSMVNYLGDDSEHKNAMQSVALAHGLTTQYTTMALKREPSMAAMAASSQSNLLQVNQQLYKPSEAPAPSTLNPVNGGGAAGLLLLMALPGLQFIRRKLGQHRLVIIAAS